MAHIFADQNALIVAAYLRATPSCHWGLARQAKFQEQIAAARADRLRNRARVGYLPPSRIQLENS